MSNGAQAPSFFSEEAVGAAVVVFNAGAGAVEVATAMARGAQSPFSARERAGAADDPGVDAEGVVNAEESTVVVVDMESKEKKSV